MDMAFETYWYADLYGATQRLEIENMITKLCCVTETVYNQMQRCMD